MDYKFFMRVSLKYLNYFSGVLYWVTTKVTYRILILKNKSPILKKYLKIWKTKIDLYIINLYLGLNLKVIFIKIKYI